MKEYFVAKIKKDKSRRHKSRKVDLNFYVDHPYIDMQLALQHNSKRKDLKNG